MKNATISLFAGLLLSAGTLYLAFRNVPFVDLVNYLASVNYLWMIPAVGVVIAGFFLRVVRWRIILSSSVTVPFWHAFHPLMIGFMMNCVLPGRVGEFGRPLILRQRDGVPFTTGLATVAAERIFDLLLLFVFFFTVLLFVEVDPAFEIQFGDYRLSRAALEAVASGMVKLSFIMIIGIVLVSIGRSRKWVISCLEKIPLLFAFAGSAFREKVEVRISRPLVRITENVAAGFSMMKYPGKILLCLGYSAVIWVLAAVSYLLVARGCLGVAHLPFLELSAVMIIVCFSIALPSVPGFWGLWEAGGVFALALFGIAQAEAAGFTLLNHVIQMFPVILVGLASALITGINILKVKRIDSDHDINNGLTQV